MNKIVLQHPVILDHIMLGFHDLQQGIEWFQGHAGITLEIGGKHPGKGTQNALASLSPTAYLEVIAPDPDQDDNAFTAVLRSVKDQPAIIAWAVQTTDILLVRNYFESMSLSPGPLKEGARQRGDGSTLHWKSMFLEKPVFPGSSFVPSNIPFFLEWQDVNTHPSKTSPSGCSIDSFSIFHPQAEKFSDIFNAIGLSVDVNFAEGNQMKLVLNSPKGKLHFSQRVVS